ncbi:UDP-N-acetylglucosamine--N-acetylmuramyl-(pentapeptide) pyrophosphoryl-undecaprenol N-acetylglucosamine transferase [soil metagenome]
MRLALSVPQAVYRLGRLRPKVVFSTGGYLAIPVLIGAALLRIPTLMWEGNSVAGRSVRATARLAGALAVSFAETCNQLPGRCYVTGTPIRSFEGLDPVSARVALELPADVPVMLVFGGSQAVRRLNEAVAAALPDLLERLSVVHACGTAAYGDALRGRDQLPAGQRARYRPFPFIDREMAAALVAADLIVGRAGSSTLAEAAALGRPIVVVPYPHASGHQTANARLLAEAGAALVVADEDFDADALRRAAALVEDGAAMRAMQAAARSLGRPGSAGAGAEIVLAWAERRPLPAAARIEQLSRAGA